MLKGDNPYEMIRKDNTNPGHFREYTANELLKISQEIGLKCKNIEYNNFANPCHEFYLLKKFNPFFKDYLTVICQN